MVWARVLLLSGSLCLLAALVPGYADDPFFDTKRVRTFVVGAFDPPLLEVRDVLVRDVSSGGWNRIDRRIRFEPFGLCASALFAGFVALGMRRFSVRRTDARGVR